MLKIFLISVVTFLGIYPFVYLRKHIITEDGMFGMFLGNYIYFSHYFLIVSFILLLVNYLVVPIPTKWAICAILLSLVFVGAVGYYNYRNSIIVNTKITLPKSAKIENIKIAFVADFHLTTTSNKGLFIDMVEKINAQNPDIIIMGGDIIQNSHTKIKDDYSKVFSNLKSKYGTYTVLGNHEYYGNDVEENIKYLKSLGIEVIRDKVLKIDGINFIARDDVRRDYTAGQRKTLKELYTENKISLSEPIIVIDHNPKSIPESIENKADIQLSAHTHAGQFFPYNMLLKSRMPNAYGYAVVDVLHTVVTSGVGVGFWKIIGPWEMPYRFGTNSEINIIDIDFTK